MAGLPSIWGPSKGLDSKDYILNMMPPGGYPTDPPQSLLNHSVTSPSQNLTDALTITSVEVRRGKVVAVTRTKRNAVETSRTYTIGVPSAIWTPLTDQIVREGCDETTFFLLYQCAPDSIYEHWFILPDAALSPLIEAEDFVTTTEDTNIITRTTELATPRLLAGYGLTWNIEFDNAVVSTFNTLAVLTEDCPGCSTVMQSIISVGTGDTGAIPQEVLTDDRFGTNSVLTSGAAVDTIPHAVYTEGDFIAVGYEITATTGEVRISFDRGATWEVVPGIAESIRDIIEVDNVLWALGGDSTGGGVLYSSADRFKTVTAVTSAALPASAAMNKMDFDPETRKFYLVGDGGLLLVGRFNGSSMKLTDISSNLNGSPGVLSGVLVRRKNEIVIAGAASYLEQSRDGGVTWAPMGIAGTDDIVGIAGNAWRMVVLTTDNIFEQTALTKYEVTAVALENGATPVGAYTDVIMNVEEDFNRFLITTDSGEVISGIPYVPNS